MHARLEGVGAGTKALLGMRDAAVAGLVADRIEAPPELTQALAGLLGGRPEAGGVRGRARGPAVPGEVARSRQGRAAIMALWPPFGAVGSHPLPEGERGWARLRERHA